METIMQSIRIAVLALALCFGASLLPVQSHAAAPLPKVKIETSMGDIVVELNPWRQNQTSKLFVLRRSKLLPATRSSTASSTDS